MSARDASCAALSEIAGATSPTARHPVLNAPRVALRRGGLERQDAARDAHFVRRLDWLRRPRWRPDEDVADVELVDAVRVEVGARLLGADRRAHHGELDVARVGAFVRRCSRQSS